MAFTDVPSLQRSPWGIVCLILNIVFSGVGSIIAGVMGKHNQTLIIGIIQLAAGWLLFWVIGPIGLLMWIWSIIWGVLIFQKSS